MNIVVPACGKVEYYPYMIECARQRSECNVHVFTTERGYISGSHIFDPSKIGFPFYMDAEYKEFSQMRWFILRYAIDLLKLDPPYYCPDWDQMIFWPVNKHIESMCDCDVLMTQEIGTCRNAAQVVSSVSMLDDYCMFVIDRLKRSRAHANTCDMHSWTDFCTINKLKVGNLCDEWDGGVFDHNVHTGDQQYVFDGSTKKIVWIDRKPYFTRLFDGEIVKARTIHCWGTYKTRFMELMNESGIFMK